MNALPQPSERLERYRPFAGVRLVALDVDGTLAEATRRDVAERTQSLLRSLKSFNVTVTVATGRAFAGAKPIIEGMSSKGAPAIVYNGAVIVSAKGSEILYRRTISFSTINAIVTIAHAANTAVLAYDCRPVQQSVTNISIGTGMLEDVTGWTSHPMSELEFNQLPVSWRHYNDRDNIPEAVAVLIISEKRTLAELEAQLRPLPDISITSSGGGYLEVRPAGVTKASALVELIKTLELTQREVLTVGDNDNDSEMLNWAGIGVAVANGTPRALEVADYVTQRATVGGVNEVLTVVREARRLFRDEDPASLWIDHQQ